MVRYSKWRQCVCKEIVRWLLPRSLPVLLLAMLVAASSFYITAGVQSPPPTADQGEQDTTVRNLVTNPGYEIFQDRLPSGWGHIVTAGDRDEVLFYVQHEEAIAGKYCAVIEHTRPAASIVYQEVKVKPDTFYKISCMVNAIGFNPKKMGVYIKVQGITKGSWDVKDTLGRWQLLMFYGQTGPEQNVITAILGIGNNDKANKGKVLFDNFIVEELPGRPLGVLVTNLAETKRPGLPVRKPGTITLLLIFAITAVIIFSAFYYLVIKGKLKKSDGTPPSIITCTYEKMRLTRKDFLLMAGLILFYSLAGLWNLGTTSSPSTFWKSAIVNESLALDLGESKEIGRVCYFLGIGMGGYAVEFSDDAEHWGNRFEIGNNDFFDKMEWRFFEAGVKARYIKITTRTPGPKLKEMAFFAPGSRRPYLIKGHLMISRRDPRTCGEPYHLFDEPATVIYNPNYRSGMYHDEVYHVRTAYEYLNLQQPGETAHPPLGKIIIALGIAIFGMSPFGWRIMGFVFGIALIPLMYLFGLRLFKKRKFAFITAFLMTFDFMHFTQSRIATLEIFAVFFITAMFYCMYKYFAVNFYDIGLGRTLYPLAFAGIFFGLAAAVKWSSLFGGAGLAIILFVSLGMRFNEFRRARAGLAAGEEDQQYRAITASFYPFTFKTLAWCLVFFIVVPLLIYGLSFIPYIMTPGTQPGIAGIVAAQSSMYRYHCRLSPDQPHASDWWEWPTMKVPLRYYRGENDIPAGKISSIWTFGNPAIWWFGILAVVLAAILAFKRRDQRLIPVFAAFASLYLTWLIAPATCTYIYHYFAVVPFLIICIANVLEYIEKNYSKGKIFVYVYLGLVPVLFIMFFPVISGLAVSRAYVANFLCWLKSWAFAA